MIELLLVSLVILGQGALFIYVLNHGLMDADAGWKRTLALFVLAPFGVVVLPVAGTIVVYATGMLTAVTEGRAAPVWRWIVAAYALGVVAGCARWLWISLAALRWRRLPSIVAGHKQFLRPYHPPLPRKNPDEESRLRGPLPPINCRFDLEVNRYELRIPDLPGAFEGFSIVHLSDVHADAHTPRKWLEHVAETANRLRPDLIAMTGDFISNPEDVERVEILLRCLEASCGLWAIRGNHDFWAAGRAMGEVLNRCGVHLLDDRVESLQREGASLDVLGIELPWGAQTQWHKPLPVPADRFTIVLTHTPDNARRLAAPRGALMLAGHHHGGQIRFPWVGSLVVPSRYGKRYDEGWFDLGPLALYVSRGLGADAPAIRILCPPEIAQFTLRCAS